MIVLFVVSSALIDSCAAAEAVGQSIQISYVKGERLLKSETRVHEYHVSKFKVCNSKLPTEVGEAIYRFLYSKNVNWSALSESYKYFDLTIEKGSAPEGFYLSSQVIEKMRELDVQVEVDITRY
jgi:hypothetical protein